MTAFDFDFNFFTLTVYRLLRRCNGRRWFEGSTEDDWTAIADAAGDTTRVIRLFRNLPITGRRSLSPLSHTCTPFGLPCGSLTRVVTREIQACPVPRN